MGSRRVIEELVVALGLDAKDFKGDIDNTVNSLDKLDKKTKSASQSMGAAIGSVAKKYLGLYAIIMMIRKTVGGIGTTADETRRLANESENLGRSAPGLRNWQNAIEALGGTAEEATGSVESFQKSLFDLVAKGQMSGNLEMLARLGVRFQDQRGHARDFDEVAKDTAAALNRNVANGTLTRAEAYQAGREAGFDNTAVTAMLNGTLAGELARARGLRQVTPEDIAKQSEYARDKTRAAQATFANVGMPAATMGAEAGDTVVDAFQRFIEWITSPSRWWNGNADPAAPATAQRAANPAAYPGNGTVPDNWLTRMAPAPPTPLVQAGGGSVNNTTNVGTVVIQSQASDARGIARDFGKELRKQNVATADAGTR
jgi:hypothetical protein